MALRRMCRTTRRRRAAPPAGGLDEFLFAQREELRAHQAGDGHPAQAADDHDDEHEHAALGA
jgi:hypothetical protein